MTAIPQAAIDAAVKAIYLAFGWAVRRAVLRHAIDPAGA